MEKDKVHIELRSEKVRNIIGNIPPLLVRCGILIISFIVIGFLVAAFLIPYPESIKVNGMVVSQNEANIYIPYSYLSNIKKGMNVKIEVEGYNPREYGYLSGYITFVDREVIHRDNADLFSCTIGIWQSCNSKVILVKNMKCSSFVLLYNKSIGMRLLDGMRK